MGSGRPVNDVWVSAASTKCLAEQLRFTGPTELHKIPQGPDVIRELIVIRELMSLRS